MKNLLLVAGVVGVVCSFSSVALADRPAGRASGPTAAMEAVKRKSGGAAAKKVMAPVMGAGAAVVHEKKLASAKSWDDVTAQLKGVIPTVVVKEFGAFAQEMPFPTIRKIKGRLVLQQEDGSKLEIDFRKDGVVAMNGQVWRLRPLATVEEEVNRLALFLESGMKVESSLFDRIIPSARAALSVKKLAALGFASATGWKADACDESKLSPELNQDCPLMAVKMLQIQAKEAEGGEAYLPTQLKCPVDAKNGALDLISKNSLGQTERLRVVYENGNAARVELAAAAKGHSMEVVFQSSTKNETNADDDLMRKKVVERGNLLRENVCVGKAVEKNRYASMLNSNSQDLRGPGSDEDDSRSELSKLSL